MVSITSFTVYFFMIVNGLGDLKDGDVFARSVTYADSRTSDRT